MGAMRIVTDEVRQFIVSLYRSGAHTQSMIAEIAGTTQSNVSKILEQERRQGGQLPLRNAVGKRAKRRQTLSASQIGSARSPLNLDYL